MNLSGKSRGLISHVAIRSATPTTNPTLTLTVPANTYFEGTIGLYGIAVAATVPAMAIDDGTGLVFAMTTELPPQAAGNPIVSGSRRVLLGPGTYNFNTTSLFFSAGQLYATGALFKE